MPSKHVYLAEMHEQREPKDGQYDHSDHTYPVGIYDNIDLATFACQVESERRRLLPYSSKYSGKVRRFDINDNPKWDIETLWRVHKSIK